MLGWFRNLFLSQRDREINRLRAELSAAVQNIYDVKASYDAAQHNDDTIGLWSKADNLSARAANSWAIRSDLVKRSRQEAGNSPHMRGITITSANDLVGTGPSLQILLDDESACDRLESAWNGWADEICLAQKLHVMALAKSVDGEAVGLLTRNDQLLSSVRLDVQVIDCDLMHTPESVMAQRKNAVDGIEFDGRGQYPVAYHILEEHPGDMGGGTQRYRTEPARNVLHWFRQDRPQQARGIPELTPALLIFGHLRQYSAAVLKASRVAASLTAIIHTKSAPDTGPAPRALSGTDLDEGMIWAAPEGYDVTQMKPEQPAATYDAYTLRKLAEACHAVCIPYSIATGDFSNESYAGGRMARQVYHSSLNVQRAHLNSSILNKIFGAWLSEAVRVPGLLPAGLSGLAANIPHAWYYDPWEHIDETKAATAITANLGNFTTTLAIECAKRKLDWRKVVKQRAKEINMQKKEGVLILPPGTPDLNGSPQNKSSEEVDHAQAA